MTFETDSRKDAPWEISPTGVVSLLEMLEFSAREYSEITYRLGLVVAKLSPTMPVPDLGQLIGRLSNDANRLGLTVTRDCIGIFINELAGANPGKLRMEKRGDDLSIVGDDLNIPDGRLLHYAEQIYSILRSELNSITFKAIPKEKSRYCDPKWLFDSEIYKHFPNAWRELQSGGRCFSFGENTACAFHLNRSLEWGLKSLAVNLGKRFDRNNWDKHLQDINEAMEAKYKSATQRSPEQEFYSKAATQFGNLRVAWA